MKSPVDMLIISEGGGIFRLLRIRPIILIVVAFSSGQFMYSAVRDYKRLFLRGKDYASALSSGQIRKSS